MNQEKYIGMDVHQATISVAVMDSSGKLIMECILETKAATILEFIQGVHESLWVTFEEGTSAAWLHDLLKPHVTHLVICDPRKNALLKDGSKSDRIDARKLAELLRGNQLKPVYHGEHGLRTLKELGRSYLTITEDLTRVMIAVEYFYIDARLGHPARDLPEPDFRVRRTGPRLDAFWLCIMGHGHGLGSCVRAQLAIRWAAPGNEPSDSTLAVPSRIRSHLLFCVLLIDFSDPWADRPGGNSTRRKLSPSCRAIVHAMGAGVVRAKRPVVVKRTGRAECVVLGGHCGIAALDAESMAARHAADLLRVFPVLRQRSAGLLGLPVRWDVA